MLTHLLHNITLPTELRSSSSKEFLSPHCKFGPYKILPASRIKMSSDCDQNFTSHIYINCDQRLNFGSDFIEVLNYSMQKYFRKTKEDHSQNSASGHN